MKTEKELKTLKEEISKLLKELTIAKTQGWEDCEEYYQKRLARLKEKMIKYIEIELSRTRDLVFHEEGHNRFEEFSEVNKTLISVTYQFGDLVKRKLESAFAELEKQSNRGGFER